MENTADKRSGCSTLLKVISGETDGFFVAQDSYLNYQGIPKETMHNDFRGECIYQAEVDVHFPQLTVGQTLDFAARARVGWMMFPGRECLTKSCKAPRDRMPGVSRNVSVHGPSPSFKIVENAISDCFPRCTQSIYETSS